MEFLSFFIIPLFLFLLSYPSLSLLFYDMMQSFPLMQSFAVQYIGYNKLIRTLEPLRIVWYFHWYIRYLLSSIRFTTHSSVNIHIEIENVRETNECTLTTRSRATMKYDEEISTKGMQIVSNSGLDKSLSSSSCSSRITDRLI